MPKPGDIGFTKMGGFVGKMIYHAQAFNGDRSQWTHCFIVLDDDTLIEAQPGGAAIFSLSKYRNRDTVFPEQGFSDEKRAEIVRIARSLEGTPYSFADYLALFLERIGLSFGLTKRYVKNTGHMICSQFCDEVYRRAGIHLFDDGRLPQDVTPGDLAIRFGV